MANLPETDEFPDGVYQLEDTDPVAGGAPNEGTGAGMDNIPHAQLARRTRWLKTRVDQLLNAVVAASTSVAGIVRLTSSLTSNSETLAATAKAVKAANDNANSRVLANAFTQSLAQTGYQKLPSGLIVQWGRTSTSVGGTGSVVFPTPFPAAVFTVFATDWTTSTDISQAHIISTGNLTLTGFDAQSVRYSGVLAASNFSWLALGQ